MSESRFSVPQSVIDLQKRSIEFQKNLFNSGFEVFARFEDQRRELATRLLEQVPNLPDEMRGLSDAWWQARINGRETYKSAVDRSFEIAETYVARIAEGTS